MRIFTDHCYLMFIFNPEITTVPLRQHTLDKLYRWSLELSSVDYVIEHIPIHFNVWADMLSRWGAPKLHSHFCRLKRKSNIPPGVVAPLQDFIFPTLKEIAEQLPTLILLVRRPITRTKEVFSLIRMVSYPYQMKRRPSSFVF